MFDWLYRILAKKLSPFIAPTLVTGGHCGLCGKWVENEVFYQPYDWRITICKECANSKLTITKEMLGDAQFNV